MTIANAAAEMKNQGQKNRIPYWRTLKSGGYLNEKYPGGARAHKALLEKEGFRIIQKGKRYQVTDFKKYL